MVNRRTFLRLSVGAAAGATLAGSNALPLPHPAEPEASLAELQAAMASGRLTAHQLVERYLARIEALNHQGPKLNAVIEVNPDILAIAAALDRERKSKGPRGPLHGTPLLLKDNIDTADRISGVVFDEKKSEEGHGAVGRGGGSGSGGGQFCGRQGRTTAMANRCVCPR